MFRTEKNVSGNNRALALYNLFKSKELDKSFEAAKADACLWFPKTFAIVFVGASSVGKTSITQFFKHLRPECQILARDALYIEKMVRLLSVEPEFNKLYDILGTRIFYALKYHENPVLINDRINSRKNATFLRGALRRISKPYYAHEPAVSLAINYELVRRVKDGLSKTALIENVMGKEFHSLRDICPQSILIYTTFEKILEHVSKRNENAIREDNIINWRSPLTVLWQYSSFFGERREDGGAELLGVLHRKTVIEAVTEAYRKEPWHFLSGYDASLEEFLKKLLCNFGFRDDQSQIDIYPRHPSKMIIKTNELTPEAAADKLDSFVKFNKSSL